MVGSSKPDWRVVLRGENKIGGIKNRLIEHIECSMLHGPITIDRHIHFTSGNTPFRVCSSTGRGCTVENPVVCFPLLFDPTPLHINMIPHQENPPVLGGFRFSYQY